MKQYQRKIFYLTLFSLLTNPRGIWIDGIGKGVQSSMTKPAVEEAIGIGGTDTSNCGAHCEHGEDMPITRALLHFLLIQLFLSRCNARVLC
jgi:hypothetical protein